MLTYVEAKKRLGQYRAEIATIRERMRELQETLEPQLVKDYQFSAAGGSISLSKLFGNKVDLFIIHNMGPSCHYCTLWADGFNGIYPHMVDRAGFAMISPEEPEAQKQRAASRGWRFPMISYQETSFGEDMGYGSDGKWMPGVSVFQRKDDKIFRVADTGFGPGDDFCAVWHLFDLLPEGANGWGPKVSYK
ncbi:MAG: DUF899 family protein [Alphaproteobacteria bacterium]